MSIDFDEISVYFTWRKPDGHYERLLIRRNQRIWIDTHLNNSVDDIGKLFSNTFIQYNHSICTFPFARKYLIVNVVDFFRKFIFNLFGINIRMFSAIYFTLMGLIYRTYQFRTGKKIWKLCQQINILFFNQFRSQKFGFVQQSLRISYGLIVQNHGMFKQLFLFCLIYLFDFVVRDCLRIPSIRNFTTFDLTKGFELYYYPSRIILVAETIKQVLKNHEFT